MTEKTNLLSPEELKLKQIKNLNGQTELNPRYFYRVKKGEIFRYVDNDLYSGLIKIGEEPSGYEDQLFNIKIPKIPHKFMKRIINFFKLVYAEHQSEAVVLIWYNFRTNDWEAEIPVQLVHGASASYERELEEATQLETRGYTLVGSIHSHGTMGAFHSGTDDADEYTFDGIHITVGKVTTKIEFACRFISKEISYKLEPEECMDWKRDKYDVPDAWTKKVNTERQTTSIIRNTRNLSDPHWWDIDGQ